MKLGNQCNGSGKCTSPAHDRGPDENCYECGGTFRCHKCNGRGRL